jgi:site-specific recombinase XerD
MAASSFSYHVQKYFAEYLPLFAGAAENTQRSYRDAFVQLLGYIESELHLKPGKVQLETLTAEVVEGFLLYLEDTKGVGVSTRNQRLAAIHSFVSYLQKKELSCFDRCSAILAVPFKKTARPEMAWMSIREVELLLTVPDANSRKGLRELSLIAILYETGARVQELIDLTLSSFHIEPKGNYVELRGKGDKLRRNPLGDEAAAILDSYLKAYEVSLPEQSVFTNSRRERLTRAGVQHILDRCVGEAKRLYPDCFKKRYSNHSLRHSKAMHLLEAGVNLIYIRDFLGHSSVTTTEIYAKTNPEIRRKIIVDNAIASGAAEHYDNDERESLLNWLKSNF